MGRVEFTSFAYEGRDRLFDQAPPSAEEFYNPILAGFYPDPSICRVGNDYYLIYGGHRAAWMLYGGGNLFNIAWPRGGMRTVIVHRADKITGPYEGRVALQDKGVAQGSLIDTPRGEWFAYLFRDFGAVGRIPYLVPVRWENGWPVLGVDGKAPDTLDLPAGKGRIPGIVASDEFERSPGQPALPLAWQWNHNPDGRYWSLARRPGFLRLTTGRVDADLLSARNSLTQRTFGPESSGTVAMDVSNMKDGDFAGLAVLQRRYGFVGVKRTGDARSIVLVSAESELRAVPGRRGLSPHQRESFSQEGSRVGAPGGVPILPLSRSV